MKNSKFEKAAILRKVVASFLTISIVFCLLSFLFYQSERSFFGEVTDIISSIFSEPSEEKSSTNYP